MSSATLQRPTGTRTGDAGPARIGLLGLVAGASAAAAGALVTAGLSLVIWAVTPSATDPIALMRAGVTAFAAGNGADVAIGASVLTLSPLLLGLFGWSLLWQAVVRTPRPPVDLPRQGLLAVTGGLSYGAVVLLAATVLGTPGAIVPGSLWAPVGTALLVSVLAVLRLSGDIRARWTAGLAGHWVVGLRLAAVGAIGVVGLGALTLAVGLVLSFGQAVTLAGASVGSGFGDSLGLMLLGFAFLPNVIVGGVGFATGAGVHVGDATFGPLGSTVGDLPALPLLAALPDSAGGAVGMVALLLPVLLGGLLGRAASARLGDLKSRCLAILTASALIGLGTALAALLAAGGVTGGRWADTGVSAWAVGLLLAAELAVTGGLVALLVPKVAVVGEPMPGVRARLKAARLRSRTAADASEPSSDESETADSDNEESATAESATAESDTAESEIAASETEESGTAEPDTAETGSEKADTDNIPPDSVASGASASDPAENDKSTDPTGADSSPTDTETADLRTSHDDRSGREEAATDTRAQIGDGDVAADGEQAGRPPAAGDADDSDLATGSTAVTRESATDEPDRAAADHNSRVDSGAEEQDGEPDARP